MLSNDQARELHTAWAAWLLVVKHSRQREKMLRVVGHMKFRAQALGWWKWLLEVRAVFAPLYDF